MERECCTATTTTTGDKQSAQERFRKHFPQQDQFRNERATELDTAYRRQWEAEVRAGPVQFSLLCDVELALVQHDMAHGRRPDLDIVAQYGNLAMLERVLEKHGDAYEWLDVHHAARIAYQWNCEAVYGRLREFCAKLDKSRSVRDAMPGLVPSLRACVDIPGLDCAKKWDRLSHTELLERVARKFEVGDEENDAAVDTFVDAVAAYCEVHDIECRDLNAETAGSDNNDTAKKSPVVEQGDFDARLVAEQCYCSIELARDSLARCNGDVVSAILRIGNGA